MPRPRRFKSVRITSIYLPVESEDVTKKAEELQKVEGLSFSELVLQALKEYVEIHYPGNPQLILPSLLDPQHLKPLRLEAKYLFKDFQRMIGVLKEKHGELSFRRDIRQKAIQQMTKLVKMNQKLKDKRIDEFIETASQILDKDE